MHPASTPVERPLERLPGTAEESRQITALLKRSRWTVNEATDAMARDSRLSSRINARVIHIATHGFFERRGLPADDEGVASVWAGLYLAGANVTLQKADRLARGEQLPPGELPLPAGNIASDDGIVTAYEIAP